MQVSFLNCSWTGPLATLFVVSLAAILGMSLSAASLEPLIIENGPFEVTSVVMHLLVAGFAFYFWRRGHSIAGLLFLASLLMAAREADLHKAFTTYGIFGTRLYFRDYVPLHEKALALGVIAAILAALGTVFWRARPDLKALRRDNRPAFFSLCALPVYLLALKEVDGMPRMLRKIGVVLSERETLIAKSIEEIGETFIPLLVLIILLQLVGRPSSPSHPAAD